MSDFVLFNKKKPCPVNTKHQLNVYLMLVHSLRRLANFNQHYSNVCFCWDADCILYVKLINCFVITVQNKSGRNSEYNVVDILPAFLKFCLVLGHR